VQQQRITLDWRWGERLFVIHNVPVGVCDQCGEKYLDNSIFKDIERITLISLIFCKSLNITDKKAAFIYKMKISVNF